jgi:hypothetical protein
LSILPSCRQYLEKYKNLTETRDCGSDDKGGDKGKDACSFDPIDTLGECATFPYGYQGRKKDGKSDVFLEKYSKTIFYSPGTGFTK